MEKGLNLWEEESLNETRQYECLRKYDQIVNQFDQMMDMVEAITQHPKKRRKPSNRPAKKKSSSVAEAIQPVPAADEDNSNSEIADQGDCSKTSSLTKAEKTSVLEQTIIKHLSDLHSDRPCESGSQSRDS